jgi:hypothetical protein
VVEQSRIEALLRDMGKPIPYSEIVFRLGHGTSNGSLADALMRMTQDGTVIVHPGTPKLFSTNARIR